MTGDVVNLRRARKAKAREVRGLEAAENRLRFGRTAAERAGTVAADARAAQHLDGHRLAPAATGDDG